MIVCHALPVTENERQLTRRRLLELGLVLPPLAVIAGRTELFSSPALAATPAVLDADDDPTPELTEGPYFTPNSPNRKSILPASAVGTRLTLTGRVLTTAGKPVPNALIDFWQADARGAYDNSGYRFRGASVHEREGPVRALHGRPRPLPGPDEAHPRQGSGAARARADDAALLPRRRRQPQRRHLHGRVSGQALAARQGTASRDVRLRPRRLACVRADGGRHQGGLRCFLEGKVGSRRAPSRTP